MIGGLEASRHILAKRTTMHRFHVSMSGMSILLALVLALWEWYFIWFAGKHVAGQLEGTLGLFTPERLGFNLA